MNGKRSHLPGMTTITIPRGTTYPITLRVVQPGTSTPVDLTGKELVFVAATTTPDQMVKKTGTGGSGFTITDAAEGLASLTLTVAETRDTEPNKFAFTVELWESAGATQTLILEGLIIMRGIVNIDA